MSKWTRAHGDVSEMFSRRGFLLGVDAAVSSVASAGVAKSLEKGGSYRVPCEDVAGGDLHRANVRKVFEGVASGNNSASKLVVELEREPLVAVIRSATYER